MSEVHLIKQDFASHNIKLSLVWLESCINWCKEENLGNTYSHTDLQKKVYEQWLLLDLRELEEALLPPRIEDHKIFILTGIFSVQILQIIDISKSKFQQIQKIRNSNALTRNIEKNDDPETGKRVLQITFTDGVQDVIGIEYKPLACFNINTRPGIKVKLIGPITVRRGRLMLEPKNIKILGGEVEEILVSHAAENVLARALNLPENPKPFSIEENMDRADQSILSTGNNTLMNLPNNSTSNIRENRNNTINQNQANNRNSAQNSRPSQPSTSFQPPITHFHSNSIPNSNSISNKTIQQNKPVIQSSIQSSSKNIRPNLNQSNQSSKFDKNEFSDLIDLDFGLDDFADNDFDDIQNNENINTIKTIEEDFEKKLDTVKTYKIKAKFKKIVEKMTILENKLHLAIKIGDDTGEIIVNVKSEVISNFAGLTPEEFMNLKQKVVNKEADAESKLIKALRDIQESLINLNTLVEIKADIQEESLLLSKML